MRTLRCWFFGCKPVFSEPNTIPFARCNNIDVSYGDCVGFTRWYRVRRWFVYRLFRRWLPAPCHDCGRRFGDHTECLPF